MRREKGKGSRAEEAGTGLTLPLSPYLLPGKK
jgi:hypothetical protein